VRFVEREQPPVTIVNPGAGEGGDVLIHGSEKLPWRPTRRQSRVTATILATVTAVVSTVWLVTDTVLDRLANADVKLQTGVASDFGPALGVVSLGKRALEIVGVRLNGAGYDEHTSETLLVHGVARTVGLPSGTHCPEDPFAPVPHEVVLTVRTERGTLVRRTVDLDEALVTQVEERERLRCGVPVLEESVHVRALSSQVLRDGVAITFELASAAVVPVTLSDWRPAAGLELVVVPPTLELPAADRPLVDGEGVHVTLRVRVQDCRTWLQGMVPDGEVNTGDAQVTVGVLAVATATRQDGAYDVFFSDQLEEGFVVDSSDDPSLWVPGLLRDACQVP